MTVNDYKATSTQSLKQKLKNKKSDEKEGEEEPKLLVEESHEELLQKLTEAEQKATQYWERMLRMQAETDNMQRRVERDIANAHKYALEKFILDLIPVIDNLERATAASNDDSTVLEGVKLTLKMLYTTLNKYNIEQIEPLSHPFNPELHQAVSTMVDTNVKPGTVLEVLQKGYLLNNRLIRPALVVVSKAS